MIWTQAKNGRLKLRAAVMNNRGKISCTVLFLGLGVGVLISCNEDPAAPAGPKIPAKVLYAEDFEGISPFSTVYSKEVGDWDYALQYVTSPVFKGGIFIVIPLKSINI